MLYASTYFGKIIKIWQILQGVTSTEYANTK